MGVCDKRENGEEEYVKTVKCGSEGVRGRRREGVKEGVKEVRVKEERGFY